MKELETHLNIGINSATKTELNIKKQQEIEYILEGTIKPKKGNVVWEINIDTMEVNKAEYKSVTATIGLSEKPIEKLVRNPNCIYISAFRKESALNQYRKNPNQSHYYYKEPLFDLNNLGR